MIADTYIIILTYQFFLKYTSTIKLNMLTNQPFNRIGSYCVLCRKKINFSVGGGAAGCVLAARLSEDSSLQVAVLEAGPDDDEFPETDLPINYFNLKTTEVDWAYKTVPRKHACAGLKERVYGLQLVIIVWDLMTYCGIGK